jgi:histidine triad (HIT) family protein
LEGGEQVREDSCIFCKIANGVIPSETIYEDDTFRVILDLGPASRGHALILPKQHYKDICELDEETAKKVLPLAAKIGNAMKNSLGCAGFNVVQNNGKEAGQTVFHFHVHLIPRYEDGPVMVSWVQSEANPEELTQTGAAIRSALQSEGHNQ